MKILATAMILASLMFLSLWPALTPAGDTSRSLELSGYLSYSEIKGELERIAEEHPDIASLVTLGTTWEGRDIIAVRLTDSPGTNEPGEPAVLIMGSHHGNELPSAEVPLYILDFLAESYESNITIRKLVDAADTWFIPLVNPDGREYAMNHDPDWRRNRRPIDADGDGTADGIGVDLNRNYGHLWGELPGSSHNPLDFNYCGPSAFSENETQAVRNLAQSVNFSISLSYHTYGDVIYYPWNNDIDTVSPESDILQAIAQDMGQLTGYAPMQGVAAYPTTGDSDDWLYSDTQCLPFTIEMGTQYVTPPEQLEALCLKNLGAALHAIGIAAEPERAILPDWTFMVYMSSDADAGLAAEALVDLNEMEAAGSSSGLNVIVLYDGMADGDSNIYHIQKDPGGLNSAIVSPTVDDGGAVISPAGEVAMSDPLVLRNFVNWTTSNYPAQKYLLSLWGHGDGVLRTILPDKGAGMPIAALNQALVGFHLDIVGFDACSLGHFEVASELFSRADIMIGSEAEEPIAGWDYYNPLRRLEQKPWMGPRELAAGIVSDYLASRPEGYATQAAIDIDVLRYRLMPAVADFVNVSADFAFTDFRQYWQARNLTTTFLARQDAVDMFEFLGRLMARNVSAPVMDRIDRILEMRDELVIHSGTGALYPDARAMAVYFPRLEDTVSPGYINFEFLKTGWAGHLAQMKSPEQRPTVSHAAGFIANNTLGPYNLTAAAEGDGTGPFRLYYRNNQNAWQSSAMARDGGVLSAEIPGQADGSFIEYYIIDASNGITEPYEVKWGSQAYFNFTVLAECDISLAWAEPPPEIVGDGNITVLKLNCSNAGPEPAYVNVTLTFDNGMEEEEIGNLTLLLDAGRSRIVEFNWTPKTGRWNLEAEAVQDTVFDRDVSDQSVSVWVNVTAPAVTPGNFLAENGALIVLLAIVWIVPAALIIHILRKNRRRRRQSAARSLNAAKEFLATAREFGGDVTAASIILARAEAALESGALPECERLVSRVRESAMESVGGRPSADDKQGGEKH